MRRSITKIGVQQHFSAEAILWGQLSHPNLLPVFGLYRYNSQLCLVSPWMENGDLEDYLKRHTNANRLFLVSESFLSTRKFTHDAVGLRCCVRFRLPSRERYSSWRSERGNYFTFRHGLRLNCVTGKCPRRRLWARLPCGLRSFVCV